MNKQELFSELSSKLASGEVSRAEVVALFSSGDFKPVAGQVVPSESDDKKAHIPTNKILYVIGAAIAIIGAGLFVGQVWDNIGSFGHIIVTLGLGLVLALFGAVLLKQKPGDAIGAVFSAMGGLLIPGGTLVTLHEMNVSFSTAWPFVATFGVIFALYLLFTLGLKHYVLTLFATANGTAFVYFLVDAMFHDNYPGWDVYAYLTMAMGITYLLLGFSWKDSWNKPLVRSLNFLGAFGFLAAAYSRVFQSNVWQLLFFLIVIFGMFISVPLKSKSILVWSTIFLIAHVSYITSKYFADSIGWPISLVILGFLFIGLGYASISINRKYIKSTV